LNKKYPEVPTIPTATEQLAKTLENLPLEDMVKKLDSMIAGLNTLVNSPDLKANFRNLNETLDQVEKLAQHFNNEVVPSIRAAVDTAGKSMAEVAPNINKTLESASAAMDAAHAALSEMKDFTAQSGQMGYEMSSAIRELSDAARSMRLLGDYLERHPESLLRGKKENKGE
jgi:paraquat-inducible protein B